MRTKYIFGVPIKCLRLLIFIFEDSIGLVLSPLWSVLIKLFNLILIFGYSFGELMEILWLEEFKKPTLIVIEFEIESYLALINKQF